MIRKTEAIVLYTQQFRETSLLATVFTREFGLKKLIVKGYRSTRGKKRHSYFQPMSIIDLVYYDKESRDFQYVSETSTGYLFKTLQTHPVRIPLGLLTIEVFKQSVKEEEQNIPLYSFLRDILVTMDNLPHGLIQVFIYYMVHLTRDLGFFPFDATQNPEHPVFFDLANGLLKNLPAVRGSDYLIRDFIHTDLRNCVTIRFSQAEKRELIDTMLEYFKYHVEGFREPASLAVFREVFE